MQGMRRFFCLLLLLMPAVPAVAESLGPFEITETATLDEYWINPGFYSYHFNKDKGLENSNYGLGLEYRYSTVSSLTAGLFHNSDRETSRYAGWYWQPLSAGPVRLGAVLGVIDGYPRMRNGGWFLAIIPVASIEHGRIGMNVAYIPSYKDQLYGSLSFQLKVRVD